jgi:hypothetical protein
MIFFKSIIIILIHYFFIHFLLYEKNIKNNFNQKIFINSITSIFIIVTLIYIFNSLNFFYFVICFFGTTLFFFKNKIIKKANLNSIIYISLFVITLIVCILPPLTSFDGRSIWFFHSKIIFFEKALWTKEWFNEEILFSQVHYPKLNAILSAYFSNLIGIWNYHFSKISLSILIFPSLMFIYKFFNSPSHGLINILILLLFFKGGLFNGYMDSILSIYTLIALLSTSKIFLKENLNEHMITSGLSIFVILNLKDEGIVITSIIFLALIYYFTLNYKKLIKNNFFHTTILIYTIGLIFYFGWKYFTLDNNIFLFFGENQITKIKINWENISIILKIILFEYKLLIYIILVAIINIYNFYSKKNKILNTFSILSLLFLFFYLSVIIFIYLISPLEIYWHLHSSVNRVILTIKTVLIFNIINFFLVLYEKKFSSK